ncbi:MAG: ATP-binding cassette domain-containing protein [Gammaproteobacteria bacterium]|nr:ATP-binding cassette domain-containing protein [Gammaproteobacteria bacterium]
MRLSGGERQRIALARALLRQPDIPILDEATNAVDNASEAVIRQALEKIAGLFTMIVHRRSSIRHSDRVVVMSAGRIVEQCHPDELIRRRGFCELS